VNADTAPIARSDELLTPTGLLMEGHSARRGVLSEIKIYDRRKTFNCSEENRKPEFRAIETLVFDGRPAAHTLTVCHT
jgi:hypothetical protein